MSHLILVDRFPYVNSSTSNLKAQLGSTFQAEIWSAKVNRSSAAPGSVTKPDGISIQWRELRSYDELWGLLFPLINEKPRSPKELYILY